MSAAASTSFSAAAPTTSSVRRRPDGWSTPACCSAHPEWFVRDAVIPAEALPARSTGISEGRWIGTVLSCLRHHLQSRFAERLGFRGPPAQWDDLKDPRLRWKSPSRIRPRAGRWRRPLRMSSSSRCSAGCTPCTDAASPPGVRVRDRKPGGARRLDRRHATVAADWGERPLLHRHLAEAADRCRRGQLCRGLCIDFYGRQQEEAVRRRDRSNRRRLCFPGGRDGEFGRSDRACCAGLRTARRRLRSSISCLSMEGQKLWNFQTGHGRRSRTVCPEAASGAKATSTGRRVEGIAQRSPGRSVRWHEGSSLIYHVGVDRGAFPGNVVHHSCDVPGFAHGVEGSAWRAILGAPEDRERRRLRMLQDSVGGERTRKRRARIKKALNSKNKVDEINLANELGRRFPRQYRRGGSDRPAGVTDPSATTRPGSTPPRGRRADVGLKTERPRRRGKARQLRPRKSLRRHQERM
jgi:iron(III) transport system substrate-binding protein